MSVDDYRAEDSTRWKTAKVKIKEGTSTEAIINFTGESTVNRSLKMLGQGALKSEALEEPIVHIDTLRDLSKGLTPSHLPQEFSLVLIKSCAVG